MTRAIRTAVAAAAIAALAAPVIAAGHGGNPAVGARNAHMSLYGFNLGVLGGMAKGDIEFNADLAAGAAGNLAALSGMSEAAYWPTGTAAGEVEGSRALPAIWENMDDFMAKSQALHDAAMAMDTSSLDGVRAGLGAVGGTCGACHRVYRAPE